MTTWEKQILTAAMRGYYLGPVHMEVGDPGKVKYPASVGLPISPYNLSLFLDRVHM